LEENRNMAEIDREIRPKIGTSTTGKSLKCTL
jgi:hypothetical protein